MRTSKIKESDLEITMKEADPLSAEDQLAEMLRMNKAVDDREIKKRLQDLSCIEHTPEELKEKARFEKIIQDAENQKSVISKQMAYLKKKHAWDYSVPGAVVDEYNRLSQKKAEVNGIINNAVNEIRKISTGKIANREKYNDYMVEYGRCFNRAAELEKTMKTCETAGDLTGYEDARKRYFEEKSKLKQLEQNKPVKLDEEVDIVRARNNLQKEIRKNALVKILFYSEMINKAIDDAQNAEIKAIDTSDAISWEHYGGKNKPAFDEKFWTFSFYNGMRSAAANTAEIQYQISLFK